MSWADFHQMIERHAAEAQALTPTDPGRARALYAGAAKLEAKALLEVDKSKARTLGITTVSAVALWFKAREFAEAQKLAYRMLGEIDLPSFAVEQLQALLQSIWSEEVRQKAAAPGSYQFVIAIEDVAQGKLFERYRRLRT